MHRNRGPRSGVVGAGGWLGKARGWNNNPRGTCMVASRASILHILHESKADPSYEGDTTPPPNEKRASVEFPRRTATSNTCRLFCGGYAHNKTNVLLQDVRVFLTGYYCVIRHVSRADRTSCSSGVGTSSSSPKPYNAVHTN